MTAADAAFAAEFDPADHDADASTFDSPMFPTESGGDEDDDMMSSATDEQLELDSLVDHSNGGTFSVGIDDDDDDDENPFYDDDAGEEFEDDDDFVFLNDENEGYDDDRGAEDFVEDDEDE